ncbi:PP2C family protein-serine/threonine phosphatase [Gryllotalpicola protaetiae]|uniref:Serine/threonine-protein phosphatase n=1 Tax=Gryllotalpicola protaetiae TaxID=2419771 RepID=A0A387BMA6_9MICO|nr:protein phosphatase 2C domain-containing protein [Gryllotalpicola protaetiae]AYG05335.1 serine/threonine-protein phosphatase [Gryllotalpicola protaetiae]
MASNTRGAAVSNVGRVRSNNQDSGYAGHDLFLVADGMGGHAGGDVASAIATNHIKKVDHEYDDPEVAREALKAALLEANAALADTVYDHPELTGMGTTVSAFIRVGDYVALAHIGDSRIYLWREGELSQISTDHTFVQRLVDTGRITEEEAAVHPRRSVLMRVLGDVDANPDVDSWILETHPGDRWMLCSDGLSGVVKPDLMGRILASPASPKTVADRLLKAALDGGAPDNVTVIVVDIDRGDQPHEPITVGSAAAPISHVTETSRPRAARLPLPSLLLHPNRPAQVPTHFEPQTEDYLGELIEEDERRHRRRRAFWISFAVIAAIVLALIGVVGYRWTQTHYFVGIAPDGNVAIFQGVQQSIGPWHLSHVYRSTDISADDLTDFEQQQLRQTTSPAGLPVAERIVNQLRHGG